MASLNKVQVIGRLGKDPEVKALQGGQTVANISLATTEKWKDKQGQAQERTEWINVVLWGKLGELAGKYLAKGSLVYIEGKLQTEQYEKDGQKRYATKVVGQSMQFLTPKSQSGGGSMSGSYTDQDAPPYFDSNEDIPF